MWADLYIVTRQASRYDSSLSQESSTQAPSILMLYPKEKTGQISFPLGGIGAGCIGLAGNGRLIDWEIFNRPNKGSFNGMSHFAVRAEKNGKVVDARILHGDLPPPYTGERTDRIGWMPEGFGWGPPRETLCGLPHFRAHTFRGEYPLAWIQLEDPEFPARVELCGWSPFIPGNDFDSSLPSACFEIALSNTGNEEIDYTVVSVLFNPFRTDTASNRHTRSGSCHQLALEHGGDRSAFDYGNLVLSADAVNGSFQEYWFHGEWEDDLEVYWRELNTPGTFRNRHYESGKGYRNTGLIAQHFQLKPGESRTVKFVITWHLPNCRNDWHPQAEEMAAADRVLNRWRNWYATQWEDAQASGRYVHENYARLKRETLLFHDSLFDSTLPEAVLDGISANLAILKSPTCLRLEDGTFYGWEGVASRAGSCEGSCTHVWNYAQALPFLFPALERSMRSSHYNYSVDEHGGCHFRLMLPLGIRATPEFHRPCVDGQFGEIMKAWRDWKISGETNWLRELWPTIKRSLEFAWSKANSDHWDPGKSGVITGRQHHTLDMELFGPNAWLNGHYLGALKAAAEIALFFGESEFAAECDALFTRGKAWTDQNLFNGEYYCQQIALRDVETLTPFSAEAVDRYWNGEHKEVKYQIGNGCEIDMHLPQWYASLYGLGEVLDPVRTKRTLQSLFKYNFVTSARTTANTWRNYCVNDEAGLQICTWPNPQEEPIIPLPYASETMHGFEWAAASHMIMIGMQEEGLKVVEAIRNRYDGEKRNPWNEFECGSNYARSMASYALLNTFSGFQFDMTRGFLGFSPVTMELPFRCFWSLGTAWGSVTIHEDQCLISMKQGSLKLRELQMPFLPSSVRLGNQRLMFTMLGSTRILLANEISLGPGEDLVWE